MDYRAVFGSIAKWVTEVDDPARIPEILSRAFHVALQGRPGPVVIALPEDMLTDTATVADAPRVEPALPWPGLPQMAELQKPPLGRGAAHAGARRLRLDCERLRGRGCASRIASPCRSQPPSAARPCSMPHITNYAGEIGIGPNPKLEARIADADLLLLVGGRLAEMPSQGYTLLDIPVPRQKLVHVHGDAGEIGRVYHPALGIHAAPKTFAASARGRAAAERDRLARRRSRGPRRLPRLDRDAAGRSGAGRHGSRGGLAAREAAGPTPS